MCIAHPLPESFSRKRVRPLEEHPDSNLENVDPDMLFSSKKTKTFDDCVFASSKPSKFVLKQTHHTPSTPSNPIVSTSKLSNPTIKSAPALSTAGRSPKGKRAGILSRRRVSSSPFTRVDPPTFALQSKSSNGLPFSIDGALSGTVPSYAPEPACRPPLNLEDAVPNGWLFHIHEDTPEEELGNLVAFSTQILDISDDESKVIEYDQSDKENIPPCELLTGEAASAPYMATITPVSRKDLMTEEVRTPLADLNTRDFYAEGCDRNSFITVNEEKEPVEQEKSPFACNAMAKNCQSVPSPVECITANQDAWKELLAQFDSASKCCAAPTVKSPPSSTTDQGGNEECFEIWESESAKCDEEEPRTNQGC